MWLKWIMGISGAALGAGWLWGTVGGFDLAWIPVLLCGSVIARSAMVEVWRERRVNSDVLVTIAIVAAVAIGEVFAAGEVALIMVLGMWLEQRTTAKAASALEEMVSLIPETARRKEGQEWREVPLSALQIGDVVLVKPGEVIPVDGLIVQGSAAVNQASLTGESVPVDKQAGDEVFVGTINTNGSLEIQASRVGEETTFAKVTRLMAEALEQKAPVQRLLDRWAAWIVPISLASAAVVYFWTGDVTRAVTILLVFCPCALVLATPTAVMAAIGKAAKLGILIKSGSALERLGQADAVLFDKTGTLTRGKLRVTGVYPLGESSEEEILLWAAALEKFSEHPIAAAVVQAAERRSLPPMEVDRFESLVGRGIRGYYQGQRILVGNEKIMEDHGISLSTSEQEAWRQVVSTGNTALMVARGDRLLGWMTVADTPRPEARETVRALRLQGIGELAMVTGDHRAVAHRLAEQVGITRVYAEQFPDEKVQRVSEYQTAGRKVAMVGDGINDAPALARAHVGIAMGAEGTQIASQAADVVILNDDLTKVKEALFLGRRALAIIRENVLYSSLINAAAVLLAMAGVLGPVAGALIHNATSVLVVMNAARLLGNQTPSAKNNPPAGRVLPCNGCTCAGGNCQLSL